MKKAWSVFIAAIILVQTVLCAGAAGKPVDASAKKVSTAVVKAVTGSQGSEELPVEIKAKFAVLMEVSTGTVLLEYNADDKLYPASVTKIMTILLVLEAVDNGQIALSDNVTCSSNAAKKGGSQIWLEEGETMTVHELLKATVIGSANDAATLLGEYVSGSETAFITLMNKRAKELGMNNTHFVNATGLDDTTNEHLTTARDIGIMTCEVMKHDKILDYSTVWMDTLRDGQTELVNTNKLVRFYKGTTGLKTGTTSKAGCCVSATAEREGLHLAAVVMGSDNSSDRFETAKALLSWGFSGFSVITPEVDESMLTDVSVLGGESKSVKPVLIRNSPVIVKKGQEDKIKAKVTLAADAEAPVIKGQKLGKVIFELDGETIAECPLIAEKEVRELTFLTTLRWFFSFLSTGEIHS